MREQNSELADRLEEIEETSNSGSSDGASDSAPISDEYIYVNDWGLKIKIPDGLKNVDYKFRQIDNNISSLSVVGVANSEQMFDFADFEKNSVGLGNVHRAPEDYYSDAIASDDSVRECGFDSGLVFNSNGYNYCFSGPQVLYTADYANINDATLIELEIDSTNLIREMLANPDNYSKI